MADYSKLIPDLIFMACLGLLLYNVNSPTIVRNARNTGYQLVVIGTYWVFITAVINVLDDFTIVLTHPWWPGDATVNLMIILLGFSPGAVLITIGLTHWIPIVVQADAEIDQRRAMEKELVSEKDRAQQASQAKSEFLANMSHEIRTPMNGVLGMIDVVLDSDINNTTRQRLEVARDSGKTLMTILNDILDLSRMESGHVEIERESTLLKPLIEEAAIMLEHQAADKSLQLGVSIDDALCPAALIDAGRYRQIMFNLIGNAIKFSQDGEIRIKCRVAPGEEGGLNLISSVSDTGIGIPQASLPDLFDRFSQADNSATRHHGGTGLGLSICKQLVDLMGGWIKVESKLGEGSEFTFMIPIEKAGTPT